MTLIADSIIIQGMERLYTLLEAADALRLSENTTRRHIKTGRLRARKIGKVWRVTQSALDELTTGDEADANDEADARRTLAETRPDEFIAWDAAKAALDAAPKAS